MEVIWKLSIFKSVPVNCGFLRGRDWEVKKGNKSNREFWRLFLATGTFVSKIIKLCN